MKKLTVILCMTLAGPAMAAEHAQTTSQANVELSAVQQSRLGMARYAGCLVDLKRDSVDAALQIESDHKLMALPTRRCPIDGNVRSFSPEVLRGALYAELYRRDYRREAPSLTAQTIDFTQGPGRGENLRTSALAFADCVARRDPLAARAFLLASVASEEENTAFSALVPQLGACVPDGQQLSMSKSFIEGMLAEVMYRQAVPGAGAAAKVN